MNVIDSLIVTLGLDPNGFKKGAAEAERRQKGLTDSTKKSGDEMTAALGNVVRQVGLLVLGFEGIKGAIGFLTDINNADAALGRLAANTGTNAHELNKWGLAAELAGGNAKDTQTDILKLSQAFTQLQTTGEISPLLLLIQKLGIATTDAEGKTRNLFDIYTDVGNALRKLPRATAFNLAGAAGVSDSTLNLLLQSEAAQKRLFAEAERNNSVNDEEVRKAQALQEEWRKLSQSARDFGRVLLEAVMPAVMELFHALEPIKPVLVDIIKQLRDAGVFTGLATALRGVAEAIDMVIRGWRELIGIIPDIAGGIAKLSDRGTKVVNQAVNAVGLGGGTANTFGPQGPVGPPPDWIKAINDSLESFVSNLGLNPNAKFGPATTPAAGGQGGGTNVQIDSITVHTQATDAQGVANELPAALRRKGVVAQADTGMN